MDLTHQKYLEHPALTSRLHHAARRDRAIAIARFAANAIERVTAKINAVRSACAAIAFSNARWG